MCVHISYKQLCYLRELPKGKNRRGESTGEHVDISFFIIIFLHLLKKQLEAPVPAESRVGGIPAPKKMCSGIQRDQLTQGDALTPWHKHVSSQTAGAWAAVAPLHTNRLRN